MEKQSYTTHLKLPFAFDPEKLQKDVHHLLSVSWKPHFNTSGYDGEWNSIALYAPGGDPDNIHAMDAEGKPFLPTPVFQQCEYLRDVLDEFKCSFQSVRLMRLCAGAKILPHTDYQSGYEDGMFRLHIPIIINDKVEFILDGQRLNMAVGECWYTNVNYEHAVSNLGTEDRIHLVIDGVRNGWSDDLFFSLADKSSFFPEHISEHTDEEKARMIEELEKMDTEGARMLLKKLKQNH